MATNQSNMPTDLSTCHEMIQALTSTVQQLQRQVTWLTRQQFGRKSEKLDLHDSLFSDWLASQDEPATKPPAAKTETMTYDRRKPTGRKPLPVDLPRHRVEHTVTLEDVPCPCCGQERVKIGEEVSEQLEYEPASVYVIQHVRTKLACRRCEGQVTIADKPSQPIEKGLAGPGLLAAVLVGKYGDHLPLYRLERILRRHGVELARSTMCQWVQQCADLFEPLLDQIKCRILQSKVIGSDDTPVRQQMPGQGKTKECRFWVYRGDEDHPYVLFDYTQDRSRAGPKQWFEPPTGQTRFSGYLQCDAYSGYQHFFAPDQTDHPAMTSVGCWAHAHRRFYDCRMNFPAQSCQMLAWIARLYEVESDAASLEASARCAVREERSRPILDQIKAWCEAQQPDVLPKSGLGEAVKYVLNQWTPLTRYLIDGDLSIDNNAVKRSLRGVAIGRKNWLFTGSPKGGQAAAVIFSLIANCQRHDIDPYVYLGDVLKRLPACPTSRLDQFLPDQWKNIRSIKLEMAHCTS